MRYSFMRLIIRAKRSMMKNIMKNYLGITILIIWSYLLIVGGRPLCSMLCCYLLLYRIHFRRHIMQRSECHNTLYCRRLTFQWKVFFTLISYSTSFKSIMMMNPIKWYMTSRKLLFIISKALVCSTS